MPQPQAYEFRDDKGVLFTAHFLDQVEPGQFAMICDGIPIAKGWTVTRRGKTFVVDRVAGKTIYYREADE